MKKINNSPLRSLFTALSLLLVLSLLQGQSTMPEVLTKNNLKEQIKYLEERTKIYENYRAIREDMYQKLNRNIIDSILAEKNRITGFQNLTADLNSKTDSLKALLAETRMNLEVATTTKNSISVLGIELNKNVYNTFMWTVIGILAILLALGFLVFKRNLIVLRRTEKDLKELKDEFAAYRQTTRLRAAHTLFVFVKRTIPWWEAAWGGGIIGCELFFFLLRGLRDPQPIGPVDQAGILLYIAGSYIGTASEHARHIWKARPGNRGHLYTEGLFRYRPPHQLLRRSAPVRRVLRCSRGSCGRVFCLSPWV